MNPRASGWILIIVSAASFGALGVLVELAYQARVDKYGALAVRFAIAAAVLLILAAALKPRLPSRRALLMLLLAGGGGYVAHSFCYFTALEFASPGLVGLLLYLYPALVAIFGRLLFAERLGAARVAALALAIAGTALTAGNVQGGRPAGIALALGC